MLSERLKIYRANPIEFVREVLQAQPQAWQAEALKTFAEKPRLAIRSGHGTGKSTLESWLVLWFLYTRPYSKVICTAPTAAQLNKILWSEINRWYSRSEMLKELFDFQKTAIYFRDESARWFATARSASKAENFAGFHEEHILIVMDEASGIADEIFETAQGALTTSDAKLILCGNPTRSSGFFFNAFHSDRENYALMKVACADSDKVSASYIKQIEELYGKESNVYRVRVLGEFPRAEDDTLIALDLVEKSLANPPFPIPHSTFHIGIDVARFGNDETVLAARIGEVLIKLEAWSKCDLMTTCGRIKNIAQEMERQFKNSAQIYVDDSGVGGGVTDRLKEIGLQVQGVNNGARANDAEHYVNRGAELWFSLRERFQRGEIILAVRDEKLIAELSTRKYSVDSRGRLMIERKDAYKKRINRSPDRADAVSLCFISEPRISAPQIVSRASYWR